MKRTTLTDHINSFRTEALTLLRFQFAWNRISKFEDIMNISRSEFVDKMISLKAIENDLVIRICKFDDDTKGVYSFNHAKREIPETHSNKKEIEKRIGEFKILIANIKQDRRHTKLAHLKIGVKDDEYDVRYNLTPCIKIIVEIIDLMQQKEISYKWSDGQYEKFDLRKEVLKETENLGI